MCIDYRLLNLLIKLSRYPLPLIEDLLVDFKSAMWFMSLDMASGFWAVRMTERAKLISAFVCPFGHFQWLRMPFGALPKIVKGIEDLPFPSTYKGVQSFLGSLNYYNRFIEDLPVVAAVLYEVDEERVRAGRNLEAAKESFDILKRKIVSTPLLRHPDRTKPFVIIPHANPWAACAVLGQEHEGLIHPVRFTGRVLKESELRYHIAEKEVLAILRTLELFRSHGSEFPVVMYTRYSVLKWLLQSNTADGRHLKWTLEIHRTQKDKDGLAAILGSGITRREHLDEVAETLIPAKGRLKVMPPVSLEMLETAYQGYVLSFDVAAKVSTRRGSCGCICQGMAGYILEAVTVNDAEYHGLILGLKLTMKYDVKELVAVGDFRIVVQQAQGLINCNQPNLKRRLAEYEDPRKNFVSVKLIYVKREFNQAADYLTSKTLVLGESWELNDPDEITSPGIRMNGGGESKFTKTKMCGFNK
ncbi:reverse transcriptase [Phytophthora megakarya]|uniref:Reverse transcriptase n=1 Tax=Phytophthora megakarya TaxID=4795 RepID=A0A225UT44_9STRA|nr:reverse transcriptase [Phytophthora megakarya]